MSDPVATAQLNGGTTPPAPPTTTESKQDDIVMVSALATPSLEAKLKSLREQSNKHSQALTQKLATSQSGQNLLHIGSSLSTLPPDLHSLLTQLHPLLSISEQTEKEFLEELQLLVKAGNEIRLQQRRVVHAQECAALYQDLCAAESHVQRDASFRRENNKNTTTTTDEEEETDELDHVLSLERAAHTVLGLVQDLETSTAHASSLTTTPLKASASETSQQLPSLRTSLEADSERAQFLMKLAPRIRKLESETLHCLTSRLERVLEDLPHGQRHDDDEEQEDDAPTHSQESQLLMIGACMRGLALLDKGKEAESVFARVAIMPLIRSKVSMGRLDQGGPRGECAGLFSLLDDMAHSIATQFGSVLRLSECIFEDSQLNLVTDGVWVPIVTALMADPAIKMAIFSPGIASILQANYTSLDTFLSELAGRLLLEPNDAAAARSRPEEGALESLYFCPTVTPALAQRAQESLYAHPMTQEFSKKWNLPIYYQLRFGECCSRLNKALRETQRSDWNASVFTESEEMADRLQKEYGLELPLFLELYDILLGLWRPDVILRPLTHRFLRGAVQLIGRVVAFVAEGLEGKIKFGEETPEGTAMENGGSHEANGHASSHVSRDPYCWGENVRDVAAVAWELTVLESRMNSEYIDTVAKAVVSKDTSESEQQELKSLARDVLVDASQQIGPVVNKCWNEVVVNILTGKCCGPLAAVKGVAATYRMTNRPPPTQASPFVATILRPLNEFDAEFKEKNPPLVGLRWKQIVVSTVANRYSVAVEELIATVQRTEEALKNRRMARRTAAGGKMSDGEKVKLQLYLDCVAFSRHVEEAGVNVSNVEGVTKLKGLTIEGEKLYEQTQKKQQTNGH